MAVVDDLSAQLMAAGKLGSKPKPRHKQGTTHTQAP